MTTSYTLNEITRAVENRAKHNLDFTETPDNVRAVGGKLETRNGVLPFTEVGLAQFARKVDIPAPYAAKLLEKDPELFDLNVNRWLKDLKQDKPILFRTNENGIRATLTDRYGILDDVDVWNAAINALETQGLLDGLDIQNFWQNDSHFRVRFTAKGSAFDAAKAYHQATRPGTHGFVNKDGDPDFLFPSLDLGNSEIGLGSASAEGGVFRILCTNGLIAPALFAASARRRHYGNSTQELYDFIVGKAEEILQGATAFTNALAESQNINIPQPVEFVGNVAARNRVSKKDEKAILVELERTWNVTDETETATAYALVNSVTAVARNQAVAERVALERVGSNILTTAQKGYANA